MEKLLKLTTEDFEVVFTEKDYKEAKSAMKVYRSPEIMEKYSKEELDKWFDMFLLGYVSAKEDVRRKLNI